jgi:DNA-binding GntR family transcriptional regulator
LLDGICNGGLPPGSRLLQEDLAERFQVSRQPISHALVLLKQQGFVRDAPGRGLEVAPIDPEHLRAVFAVRAALDELAATTAATRALAGNPFELVLEAGHAAADSGDVAKLIHWDVAFHALMADAAGNPVLVDLNHQQWGHIRRGITVALQDPAFHRRCWAEHTAISEAILTGNAVEAGRIARRHCEIAGDETFQRLAEKQ